MAYLGGTLNKSVYTNFFADWNEQACQTDTFDCLVYIPHHILDGRVVFLCTLNKELWNREQSRISDDLFFDWIVQ